MDENLNNSACENFGTAAATVNSVNSAASATEANATSTDAASAKAADKRREERVKRMRGWLGVKSTTPSFSHGDDGGPVSYGDAPNGWNR